jgi:hypothetical protein
MIDSILFSKEDKSCLIFDGLCKDQLSTVDQPLVSPGFFVDDLSFRVFVGSFIYLFSFELDNKYSKQKKVDIGITCEVLNKEISADFSMDKGRIFIRKKWLEMFGVNTMFSKFNIKKDYVFKCNLVRVPSDIKFNIIEDCNLTSYIHVLSKILKGRYKVRIFGRSTKRRALVFSINNIEILDPSLFALEKI